MKHKKPALLLLFLAGLLLPSSASPMQAHSADRKAFSITPKIGICFGTSFGRLVPAPQTADVPEIRVNWEPAGPVWGVDVGVALSGNLEIHGEMFTGPHRFVNDVGIGLAGIPLGKVTASDVSLFSAGINLLYFPLQRPLSPYITAGAGIITLKPDQFRTKTRLAAQFGAGARARLGKAFQLSVELRDVMTFFDYGGDFRVFFAQIYSQEFHRIQHQPCVYMGLGYRF